VTDLLEVTGLTKVFGGHGGLKAVDDASFTVKSGQSVGLVGESGSGKSTLARCILRLVDITSGTIMFEGTDVSELKGAKLRQWRMRVSSVFQEPYDSLDPRYSVGAIVREPVDIHMRAKNRAERTELGAESLRRVGLAPEFARRRPHELSGGQQQRVAIARAIATNPALIVLDEPTAALDVSVRAQILNLLGTLRDEMGSSLLFISHDLSSIRYLCDEILVMYRGRIVEQGPTESIFADPRHPYTRLLLSAALPAYPVASLPRIRRPALDDVRGAGCVFAGRCDFHQADCDTIKPPLELAHGPRDEHRVACLHNAEIPAFVGPAARIHRAS
jgi:oligopeptide/dipeptide ABC transporter ATP-binding protein